MTPTATLSPAPLVTPHWFAAHPALPSRGAEAASLLTCHLGISTRGDPRNPSFLVSHLLVRFPHRKHVNDLSKSPPDSRGGLFHKASKKPLNSEPGPREPKSDAKLQPLFHMAKYFHKKMQKKRRFNILLQNLGHFFGKEGLPSGRMRVFTARLTLASH